MLNAHYTGTQRVGGLTEAQLAEELGGGPHSLPQVKDRSKSVKSCLKSVATLSTLVKEVWLLNCLCNIFASAGLEGRISHGCLVAGTAAEVQSEARSEAGQAGIFSITQATFESNQSPQISQGNWP